MQLITFLSTAAAVATVSANLMKAQEVDSGKFGTARIINRCDYPVYIWSIYDQIGCSTDNMVTLKKGETFSEKYRKTVNPTGVSIKVSKTQQCKGNDIVQLEYYLELSKDNFIDNYLDVSYVDCLDGDCPTKNEGYYLQSGSQTGVAKAAAGNTRCPILSCSDPVSCAKMSYILPDDVQTKTCGIYEDMDFYMCGSEAPTEDYQKTVSSAPVPASSSEKAAISAPKPSTTSKAASSAAEYNVNVAAVTNAPEVKDSAKNPKVKTKVVYVTAYEYVNAKRHEHAQAHARRHQPFHA